MFRPHNIVLYVCSERFLNLNIKLATHLINVFVSLSEETRVFIVEQVD